MLEQLRPKHLEPPQLVINLLESGGFGECARGGWPSPVPLAVPPAVPLAVSLAVLLAVPLATPLATSLAIPLAVPLAVLLAVLLAVPLAVPLARGLVGMQPLLCMLLVSRCVRHTCERHAPNAAHQANARLLQAVRQSWTPHAQRRPSRWLTACTA